MMGSKDLSVRVYHNINSKNMSLTVLSGHRDRLVGAFFSKDGQSAYTVARDGAIFSWRYELVDVEPKAIIKDKKSAEDIEDVDEEDDVERSDDEEEEETVLIKKKKGLWKLVNREFLWEPHTQVTSAAFNKSVSLLVVGFDKGVFGLYEMPGCVNLHRLSVSHHSLNTACINNTGEWLALGSTRLGQLLVWEWQSETYVLKQQGHLYGISTLDFSSDGQFIATGGEDSKVKLWNASSGFCFVTFSEHVAPVTGIRLVLGLELVLGLVLKLELGLDLVLP
jgi:periodic tryptophan protein 2